MIKKLTKFLLIPLLVTAQIQSMENAEVVDTRAIKALGAAALFCGAYYGANLTAAVLHELGHATTGKALYNDPINITLGQTPKSSTITFKINVSTGEYDEVENTEGILYKNPYVTINRNFFKNGGGSSHNLDKDSRIKNFIVSAAGPVVGTSFGALITKYAPYPYNVIGIPIIITNLTQFIPFNINGSTSDGRNMVKQIFDTNKKYRKFDVDEAKAAKYFKAKYFAMVE
ncbi:MAG: hypothetical protein WC707_03865 [Candidatus Babeliaceae bacterium]|jgi:hypothetical protein